MNITSYAAEHGTFVLHGTDAYYLAPTEYHPNMLAKDLRELNKRHNLNLRMQHIEFIRSEVRRHLATIHIPLCRPNMEVSPALNAAPGAPLRGTSDAPDDDGTRFLVTLEDDIRRHEGRRPWLRSVITRLLRDRLVLPRSWKHKSLLSTPLSASYLNCSTGDLVFAQALLRRTYPRYPSSLE